MVTDTPEKEFRADENVVSDLLVCPKLFKLSKAGRQESKSVAASLPGALLEV